MSAVLTAEASPYVGPRPFEAGEQIFGREREEQELLDLLIGARIVLLYSPSGAGKTSLIQAALIPALKSEGFEIRPVVRVTNPAVAGGDGGRRANRYLASARSWLDPDGGPQHPPDDRPLGPDLAAYLGDPAEPEVLIFDQFEEILTIDPTDDDAKAEFFAQVGAALRNRRRWALFSMREDYVAGLDPYRHLVPTGLSTTFRLDLLGVRAALEAIRRPPERFGVTFAEAAAEKLVDDLRRVRVQQPDGDTRDQLGLHVEPVHLQVVCRRLWERRTPEAKEIALDDVQQGGDDGAQVSDVDAALAEYYAERVAAIETETGVPQRFIREWVERFLITPQGIRGQVLQEPERTQGLDNGVIRRLEDAHLVRADRRRNATWYELVHDRLLKPLLANNTAWFDVHLSPLQAQARLWERQGRLEGSLLRGEALRQAEAWAAARADDLTSAEQDFLDACRAAQQRAETERRRKRQFFWLAIVASALFAVAALLFVVAMLFLARATEAELRAQAEALRANAEAERANEEAAQARTAEARAVEEAERAKRAEADAITAAAAATAAQEQAQLNASIAASRELATAAQSVVGIDPELSVLLALQAVKETESGGPPATAEARQALHRAVQASRVRATLSHHTDLVHTIAYSPNGALLASAGSDGSAQISATAPGAGPPRTVARHAGAILSIAFDRAGTRLATAGQDGLVGLWETSAGSALLELDHGGTWVRAVAFSADDRFLATGAQDRTVRVWNAASGALVHTLNGHSRSVWSVAFSPSGNLLASGDAGGSIILWDAASGRELGSLDGHITGIRSIAFSPDGGRLAAASEKVIVRDTISWTPLPILPGHNSGATGVAFSPDGKRLVTGGGDRLAKLWDAETGAELLTLAGHADIVLGVAFHPDGKQVATASADRSVKVWDAAPHLLHSRSIQDVSFSPDGRWIATASDDATAQVWDAQSGAPRFSTPLRHDSFVRRAVFSPDSSLLATASADGTARIWDAGGNERRSLSHSPEVDDVAFNHDGTLLATAGRDYLARVWDPNSDGEPVATLAGHAGWVSAVAFSPDGKRLATASLDSTVKLWNTATWALEQTLSNPAITHHGFSRVVFSPDSSRLATVSTNGMILVWEVDRYTLVWSETVHAGRAHAVAFDTDGGRIATGGEDRIVRVLDATSQANLLTLREAVEAYAVAFSPDGKRLAVASQDPHARLYALELQDLIALARQRLTRTLSPTECSTYLHGPCP